MIVLNTPKGWTGPKFVDGQKIEGTYRVAPGSPSAPAQNPEHLRILESWMRSYKPQELFDKKGRLVQRSGGAGAQG